jgi:hypothetical protein
MASLVGGTRDTRNVSYMEDVQISAINPIDVHKALKDAAYPAERDDLVRLDPQREGQDS